MIDPIREIEGHLTRGLQHMEVAFRLLEELRKERDLKAQQHVKKKYVKW